MAFEFPLPDVGEGLTEADIVSWKVAPGDEVTVLRIDGATLVVRPLPRIDWEADGA